MIKITENSIFEATPISLPLYSEKITGDLYEDFYVVPVKYSDGTIVNHYIQSGNFYLREYYLDTESGWVDYNDFKINPETLVDVTNINEPIFVGCDLAREIDLTYYGGRYYGN